MDDKLWDAILLAPVELALDAILDNNSDEPILPMDVIVALGTRPSLGNEQKIQRLFNFGHPNFHEKHNHDAYRPIFRFLSIQNTKVYLDLGQKDKAGPPCQPMLQKTSDKQNPYGRIKGKW